MLVGSVAVADNPYRTINNLNAGELTPLLDGREDLVKYQSGLSTMENAIPIPQGGAEKRPGTKYIAEVKTSSLKTRLLPFEFSTTQSYIIEAGNQYFRFYAGGEQITSGAGTEDLSGHTLVAHWLFNDNLGTTAVLDDDGGTYDGTATTNTDAIHKDGYVGTGCFELGATHYVTVSDNAAFTFDDKGDGLGSGDDFSIGAWVSYVSNGTIQQIVTKSDVSHQEYLFRIDSDGKLNMRLTDNSATKQCGRSADVAMLNGWHFVVVTYEPSANNPWSGNNAADDMILYMDGAVVASTATCETGYDGMENKDADLLVGALLFPAATQNWVDQIDDVFITSDVLTAGEILALYGSLTSAYEIETPYLTADLFKLKYKQSADVLYITYPDYEPRKLSRVSNTSWTLDVIGIEDGPFRTQNTDAAKTITADGTTGSITLTATGHAPFVGGTTAGQIPSGALATSKSQTGALFKLVHPIDELEFKEELESDFAAGQVEDTSWVDCGILYKGATWALVTGDTWFGTIKVQRNYTIGAAVGNGPDEGASVGWETVLSFSSGAGAAVDARNVSETGIEDDGDAQYRVIYADETADDTVSVYFSTDQTEHVGVVKITAITDSTTATGTVLATLASTDATHKWCEGAWSNYRGWPGTVAFFEDRLMFGGNTAQPDTIWGSVSSEYEDFSAGADDSDAVIFTLSSRQVNKIEWLVGKDKLLIGTSGAEWTIAGGTDEPLTPSNVIAKQHSTYGSANLQANLANESILFFQRGSEKMRELAYNWELDSYVAPDMTILANFVTDTGITDTAFQRTPNSILWTTRTDGELPIFSYERAENITAWSRMITQTNLAGTLTDSDIESVAVINGSPEDEVWVIVKRTIQTLPVRYIEQFQPRDFGDSEDAIFVDSCVTYDSTASSAMTGLDHLTGQTVYVLADGVQFDTELVAGGAITLSLDDVTTTASTVQMGLGYEVQLRTMPLSWVGPQSIQGKQKKIGEVISRWYKSGDFSIGRDVDTLQSYSITNQTTDIDRKTFPPGWDRNGYIFIYQLSPEPLTILSLAIEFNLR